MSGNIAYVTRAECRKIIKAMEKDGIKRELQKSGGRFRFEDFITLLEMGSKTKNNLSLNPEQQDAIMHYIIELELDYDLAINDRDASWEKVAAHKQIIKDLSERNTQLKSQLADDWAAIVGAKSMIEKLRREIKTLKTKKRIGEVEGHRIYFKTKEMARREKLK